MFVVSDIYDLEATGRCFGFQFNEQLSCGVAVHAREWPGSKAAAQFLIDAANISGVWAAMAYAGYEVWREKGSRSIKPKTMERIAMGGLPNARDAFAVTIGGETIMLTKDGRTPEIGGHCAGIRLLRAPPGSEAATGGFAPGPLKADFVFPFDANSVEVAPAIRSSAVSTIDGAYGYAFVRDAYCYPQWYARGLPNEPFFSHVAAPLRIEIGEWFWYCDERIWSPKQPVLRDLFAINLLSNDHLSSRLATGEALGDWIGHATDRGRLEPISRDRWLWSLTDLEIYHARMMLIDAGLLFSSVPRVYRDLSPAYSAARLKPMVRDPGPFPVDVLGSPGRPPH